MARKLWSENHKSHQVQLDSIRGKITANLMLSIWMKTNRSDTNPWLTIVEVASKEKKLAATESVEVIPQNKFQIILIRIWMIYMFAAFLKTKILITVIHTKPHHTSSILKPHLLISMIMWAFATEISRRMYLKRFKWSNLRIQLN